MNKQLLKLSGLAILAVVMNHASYSGFVAMFWWTDRYLSVTVPNYDQMGSLSYFGLVAEQKLAIFSVPAFLFITGMFLSYAARGSETHLTWKMISRRVLNLLPPYLIWTVIYFAVEFLISGPRTPVDYILSVFTINKSVFFYIPLIIFYYLLSPILAPWAKKKPKLLLAIGGGVLLFGVISGYIHYFVRLNENSDPFFRSPISYLFERKIFEYFFYYVLGLVAGFHIAKVKEVIIRYRWFLLGLAILMGILAVAEAEWVFQTTDQMWRSRTLTLPSLLYSISFILAFLAFLAFEKVKLPDALYQLGSRTLGIYLIHQIVIMIVPKVVYHLIPFVLGIQLIYQPLLVFFGISIPLLLMGITRKLPIKKFSRIIFG